MGRALLLDLNNFARYPSIAVGYLAAVLRAAGRDVRVLSPFAHGYAGVAREPRARPWSLLDERLRYWSATSRSTLVRTVRSGLARRRRPKLTHEYGGFLERVRSAADESDVVLVSTYLMYRELCERIGAVCEDLRRPLLVGGPYFAQPEVLAAWQGIPGLTALVGGEPEAFLPELVERAISGDPLDDLPGVITPATYDPRPAPPLDDLDRLPFPDYTDFPWDAYPQRIVPVITGRGCGWGHCTFCSDVTSSAGRTFRSRSVPNVLEELAGQAERHDARNFVFTDLKLNSNPDMWTGLIERIQATVPGARWIASLHVGPGDDTTLAAPVLRAAAAAGLTRLTTGLESGSQGVLNLMRKGTRHDGVGRVLRNANTAGISVRTTMILGYPGETAEQVAESAAFVESHHDCIERVTLNRFQVVAGTPVHRVLATKSGGDVSITAADHRVGSIEHDYAAMRSRDYRRAVTRLLRAVHRINRKQLRPTARVFDGVM